MIKSILANIAESVRESLQPDPAPPVELPLFPLGSVLFPGGTLALKIFEQRYLDMAKTCLKDGSPFGVVLIREGQEVGLPAVPESVGTVARIAAWDMQDLGILQLRVKGTQRFKIVSASPSKNGLIIGQVAMLNDDLQIDCPDLAACAEFLGKIFAQIGTNASPEETHFDDAAWIGYRLTELLPFPNAVKQKMLELTDARMRLEILHRFLSDQRLIG